MRLIIMFDLPVETAKNKRDYRQFVKFLINSGYIRVQYSIYAKLLMNHSVLQYQLAKLKSAVPPTGVVQTLVVTEKQFASMNFLVGGPSEALRTLTTERMIEI